MPTQGWRRFAQLSPRVGVKPNPLSFVLKVLPISIKCRQSSDIRSGHRRTVAEVPTRVLRAGCMDASLITGLLAETGTPDLRTYAFGFETDLLFPFTG